MTPQKLNQLKRKFEEFRGRGGIRSSELEEFAKALGRTRHRRGKEPTWISESFSDLRPVSIPHHSKDLNKYTAQSILDHLEYDLERLETVTHPGNGEEKA
jgi:hypothetical protein